MSAREFYELVVRMRAAQKLAGMTVKYEDIQLAFDYEKKVDAEIDRVTRILNQQQSVGQYERVNR
jgi:hypothetical protein